MPVSPGALHTELFIFNGALRVVSAACVDPSKPVMLTPEVAECAQDMLDRWESTIKPMLSELLGQTKEPPAMT